MKRIALVLLLAFIVAHTPWKLMALGAEVLVMTPGPYRASTSDSDYWETLRLEARVVALGYSVGYEKSLTMLSFENGVPQLVRVWGSTDKGRDHKVMLEEHMHWNARRSVLAHEAGHILQPVWVNEDMAEAFAESVGMLVAHDGLREHARYLSRDKVTFFIIALTEWRAIYHSAATLEDR